uniref:Ig-like domain-containing protein n=1 Tax=Mastacembelus armatus TaxID=205130 RepID=A0A7N9AV43_9TELE
FFAESFPKCVSVFSLSCWYRNLDVRNKTQRPTHNEYRITAATESDSGKYSCRGRNDYLLTEWSKVVTLTVSGKMNKCLLYISFDYMTRVLVFFNSSTNLLTGSVLHNIMSV